MSLWLSSELQNNKNKQIISHNNGMLNLQHASNIPVSIVSANFSSPSKGWKLSPISSVSFWLRHSLASCMLLVMKLDQYMGSLPDAGGTIRVKMPYVKPFLSYDGKNTQILCLYPLLVLVWAPSPNPWPPGHSFPVAALPRGRLGKLSGWTQWWPQKGHLLSLGAHWGTEEQEIMPF